MEAKPSSGLVLGLDLGVSSCGWALLDPKQHKFVAAGVRVFDSGMDEKKFEKGEQGASNNVQRRMARLHRRQLRRRAARRRDLFLALQDAGLLPPTPRGTTAQARHDLLDEVDGHLRKKWKGALPVAAPDQVLPYYLRSRALDEKVDKEELGRALYHLGQRRGYKSNRKEGRSADGENGAKKTEKDEGKVVLEAITGLEGEIALSGARTLGEFLSRTDPTAARIRTRHTGRAMFESEFEKIWNAQERHYPELLNSALKERLHNLLFFQRPIAPGKRGKCELELGCVRADMYMLAAQRFRLLQKVNDLTYTLPDETEHKLTSEQRARLLQVLQEKGDLTFAKARELFALPKKARFNLELGGDGRLRGNRTNAAMLRAFGHAWNEKTDAEHNHIVRRWANEDDFATVYRIATHEWGLDGEAARELAGTEAEQGLSRLSIRAINKLLPFMEAGTAFKTAEREIYGDRFAGEQERDRLLPVEDVLPLIPNPAVLRALTELRKVVNGIVREYGKPAQVRLELARDLKRSARDRQHLIDVIADNRKRRAKVVAAIQKETGISREPSGRDIEKGLLFEDLQECTYCGKPIKFADLFSQSRLFDVDHIIPASRFPDNSYGNKVLACSGCNALKTNRTPFEAFGSDAERWSTFVARVSRKRKSGKFDAFVLGRDKRERLLMETVEQFEKFSARHLTDTRYITKLAARYLEQLYGGRDREVPEHDQRRRCIFASSGAVTFTLRKSWGLEALLPSTAAVARAEKERTDHRHHAVDAMVIALSSQSAVQQLSAAAAVGDGRIEGRVSSRTLQAPWPGFVDSLRALVENIRVSHRPNHRLNGGLHEETNYSAPKRFQAKMYLHTRKPVHLLTAKQIGSNMIVDAAAQKAVEEKLKECGDPKKFENDPPVLRTRSGKCVPIRRVRVRVATGVEAVGAGERERHVTLGNNHHVGVFATKNKKGRPAWETPGIVTRLEAMQRHAEGRKIISKSLPEAPEAEFLFSLTSGDIVEMDDTARGSRGLFVVRTISEQARGGVNVEFCRAVDARRKEDMKSTGDFIKRSIDVLRQLNCRKVYVDVLGRVRSAND